MSQPIREIKTDNNNKFINELSKYVEEKYKISKELFLKSIDRSKIEYKLQLYKISFNDIDNEIEALNLNEKNSPNIIDTIKQSINILIKRSEETSEQNNKNLPKKQNENIVKQDAQKLLQQPQNSSKKAPAKNSNISINKNINVKYNTTIIYNAGDNIMEK